VGLYINPLPLLYELIFDSHRILKLFFSRLFLQQIIIITIYICILYIFPNSYHKFCFLIQNIIIYMEAIMYRCFLHTVKLHITPSPSQQIKKQNKINILMYLIFCYKLFLKLYIIKMDFYKIKNT